MSVLPGKLPPVSTGRLPGGLLSAARELPASFDQWRQGVSFNSHLSTTRGYHECVNPEDAEDKDIDTVGDVLTFDPFLIYSGRECSTWMDAGELLDLAKRGMEATISGDFAVQLMDPQVGDNEGLASSATVLSGGDPLDIVSAMSQLTTAACDCGVNDLTFHVNLRVVPYLLEKRLINWTGENWKYGPWTVSADCYSEDVAPGEEEAPEDESETFIYVTGPVEIAVATSEETQGVQVATNEQLQLVEHLAILRFDSSCVKAARVQLFEPAGP